MQVTLSIPDELLKHLEAVHAERRRLDMISEDHREPESIEQFIVDTLWESLDGS